MNDVAITAHCRANNGLDRRTLLAGIAALAATRPAAAADATDSPIARGVLANNPLAQAFEAAPIFQLPDVMLTGPNGDQDIADLIKGRTIIMPLWAEWCAPCLSEIPDFARIQAKYGNANFAVVPVLTGARKQVTPETLTQIFAFLHAGVFAPLVEEKFGKRLLVKMAARNNRSFDIPCNLLIAPNGHVVAREFGLKRSDDQEAAAVAAGNVDPVARAEAGETLSLWGKAPGQELAAALAGGFLARG